MVKLIFAFVLLHLHGVTAEPVPLRGGGRAAMEFELAAREMRRADEEIKAAAWDEENSGRTPAVDAAVAELALAARNVAQVTEKVVAEVSAQPEKKSRTLHAKIQDTKRYQATADAVLHQRQQIQSSQSIESSTDAVVQAIAQHSHERKMKTAIAASTDEAVKAIRQHGIEHAHRKAMNSVTEEAVSAINRHIGERDQRRDMDLATDILAHGVAQNSHERAVVDATRVAADLVRQHLGEQDQGLDEDPLPQDSENDEDTFQDLAQDA